MQVMCQAFGIFVCRQHIPDTGRQGKATCNIPRFHPKYPDGNTGISLKKEYLGHPFVTVCYRVACK